MFLPYLRHDVKHFTLPATALRYDQSIARSGIGAIAITISD